SAYTIDGFGDAEAKPTTVSLSVAPGAQVAVSEPVDVVTPASSLVPTGGDPGSALQIVLLPEYLIDPTRARVTQRQGASITLEAS
ncbi:hypothetical protein, partial [Staphylococcus aureus]